MSIFTKVSEAWEMIDYKNDELYPEIGLCDMHKCKTCKYVNSPGNKSTISCDYIVLTGHRRPCPAGRKCTAYEKAIKIRRMEKMCL